MPLASAPAPGAGSPRSEANCCLGGAKQGRARPYGTAADFGRPAMQALCRVLPPWHHRRRDRQDVEFRVVPGLNGLMRALLAVERRVVRRVSLPMGSSIIAVAARAADGSA